MRLSRERKLYVAILGLGLLALGADRAFFLSPAGVHAAAPDDPTPPPESPLVPKVVATAPAQAAEPGPAPCGPSLHERLSRKASWNAIRLRDAFEAPVQWVGQRIASSPTAAAPTVGSPFAERHKLTAVLASENGGQAAIDGDLFHIGSIIEGYTLREILVKGEDRSVVFEKGEERVTLTVPKPKFQTGTPKPRSQIDVRSGDPGFVGPPAPPR